ncbi:hypothetical protein GF339_08795 [candidate division KSB3 bacterium]|uniref:Uncharacterized protein n=1 Tax=candidate division KSB3 bacterium TaxID=2044937 RepID=A0A9D5JUT4_9BACT|nr:hypothetical protein [candidate division KSB3 bacterium]MBD3324668.1 hypothetical protein [candidate division KSB3 bacterium]
MKCPTCSQRMGVQYRYDVQGKRYGMLPGVVRVYACSRCHRTRRTLEVAQDLLRDQADHHEARRQRYLRETATLKEKLDWMMRPSEVTERKLKRVRAKAIELMELTF